MRGRWSDTVVRLQTQCSTSKSFITATLLGLLSLQGKDEKWTNEDAESEQDTCAICFEAPNKCDRGHRCVTCKPDAWTICGRCEFRLIGKPCPVCASPSYGRRTTPTLPRRRRSTSVAEADAWWLNFCATSLDGYD